DDVPLRHPAVIPDSNAPLHHPAIIPDDVSAQYAARTVDMPPLVIPDAPPLPPLPVLAPHAPSPTAQRQRLSLDDLSLPPPPLRMPISQGDSEPIELEVLGDISIPAPPRAPDFSEGAFATAEELVIAPDVQPGETRFSNIPRARGGLSLDLTELELEPRRLAAPPSEPAQEEPGETTVAELSKLPLFPLFAELPRQALGQLVRGAEVLEFEDGEAVVRKGEESDALYGIVDGSVAIIAEQNLQITLAEGDVFGEACLLPGERRHADVIVVGHLTVLKIGRDLLNQMLTLYPQLAEILLELLTRRLLGNLLQSSPLFLEFDAHGRQELAGLFEIRRAPQGIVLAEAGKRVDGLYINLTGGLEITYADGRPFEHMRAGTMFGHEGMITRQPSQIGVRALSNMIILRLPAEAFNTLVMQYPAILAKLSELSVDPVAKVCF
ncbi:MAG: cyclic nucleotide-binding domain-containing protein, partial [Myxococcales bacterium]|nr:cyclic nucleotide-binding domain-containing protein [Myxococcales bacterium]